MKKDLVERNDSDDDDDSSEGIKFVLIAEEVDKYLWLKHLHLP